MAGGGAGEVALEGDGDGGLADLDVVSVGDVVIARVDKAALVADCDGGLELLARVGLVRGVDISVLDGRGSDREVGRSRAGVVALERDLRGRGAGGDVVLVGDVVVARVDRAALGADGDGRLQLGASVSQAVSVDDDLGIFDRRGSDGEVGRGRAGVVALEGDGDLRGAGGDVVLVRHVVVRGVDCAALDADRDGGRLCVAVVSQVSLVGDDDLRALDSERRDREVAGSRAGVVALAGHGDSRLASGNVVAVSHVVLRRVDEAAVEPDRDAGLELAARIGLVVGVNVGAAEVGLGLRGNREVAGSGARVVALAGDGHGSLADLDVVAVGDVVVIRREQLAR